MGAELQFNNDESSVCLTATDANDRDGLAAGQRNLEAVCQVSTKDILFRARINQGNNLFCGSGLTNGYRHSRQPAAIAGVLIVRQVRENHAGALRRTDEKP